MTKSPRSWEGNHAVAEVLDRIPPPALVPAGLGFLLLITSIDYATGTELSFSIFYLLPVSLITWKLGRGAGLIFSLLSSAAWLLADTLPGQLYSHPSIPVWNALVRFGFFVITVTMLASLRSALAREQSWARTDPLTGLANGRLFREILREEISRSRRYSHRMSLAYLDLDNFKSINDRLGHATGDEVLRAIGALLKSNCRGSDTAARLAGDEFALLMPEAGEPVARVAVERIRKELINLMRKRGWEVTSSIGLVSYLEPPGNVDVALKAVDSLMYMAKNAGKDRIFARVPDSKRG